jgi:hypothetical protein
MIAIDLPKAKYSRGKIVPHLDIQVWNVMEDPRQKDYCKDVKFFSGM